MDTLAALALATGPPSIELLNRPPYRKFEYIISRKMLKHIIGQAIFQNILLYAVIFGFIGEIVPLEAEVIFNTTGFLIIEFSNVVDSFILFLSTTNI